MPTATLRTVGGSVMVAIPKPLLELVRLESGAQVELDVQDDRLIVSPRRPKRYTLAELLAQCDPSLPLTQQEQEWLDVPSAGLEAN